MKFFLKSAQNEILKILKMFKYNMKFTRINSKIRKRDETSHSWYSFLVTIVSHYYDVIIMVFNANCSS